MGPVSRRLGDILVEDYRVQPEDVDGALRQQKLSGERLGRLLVRMGVLSDRDLVTALGQQLEIPVVLGLARREIPEDVLMLVPHRLAEKKLVIPLAIHDERLILAMADPTDDTVARALEGIVRLSVWPCIAPEEDVRRALKVFYMNLAAHRDVDEITGAFESIRKRLHGLPDPSEIPGLVPVDPDDRHSTVAS